MYCLITRWSRKLPFVDTVSPQAPLLTDTDQQAAYPPHVTMAVYDVGEEDTGSVVWSLGTEWLL